MISNDIKFTAYLKLLSTAMDEIIAYGTAVVVEKSS